MRGRTRASVSCWSAVMAATPTVPCCANCRSAPLSLVAFAKMRNCFTLYRPSPLPAAVVGPAGMVRRRPHPNKCCTTTPCPWSRSAVSPPEKFAKSGQGSAPPLLAQGRPRSAAVAGGHQTARLSVAQGLQTPLSSASLSHLHRSATGPTDTGAGLRGSLGDRVQPSRRKVADRRGAGPRLEPASGYPFAPVSGSHLQLVAFGFYPGLWISAHRRLSAAALMETKVDSTFDPGPTESAARSNLRASHAG